MAALGFCRWRRRLLWLREEDTQVMGSDGRPRRVRAAAFVRTIERPMLADQIAPVPAKARCGCCEEFT